MAGRIDLILGPMFSSKSTMLLGRLRRYVIAKKKCLVIKSARDTRYLRDKVVTHDQQQWDAIRAYTLDEVQPINDLAPYDVIGIDEGQFFADIVPFCERMANAGKIVIVAALDGTFQRLPFGSVLDLIPKAESVVKLSAVCMFCQQEAAFSKRITDDSAVELIGGSESYVAVCRKCFFAAQEAEFARSFFNRTPN